MSDREVYERKVNCLLEHIKKAHGHSKLQLIRVTKDYRYEDYLDILIGFHFCCHMTN